METIPAPTLAEYQDSFRSAFDDVETTPRAEPAPFAPMLMQGDGGFWVVHNPHPAGAFNRHVFERLQVQVDTLNASGTGTRHSSPGLRLSQSTSQTTSRASSTCPPPRAPSRAESVYHNPVAPTAAQEMMGAMTDMAAAIGTLARALEANTRALTTLTQATTTAQVRGEEMRSEFANKLATLSSTVARILQNSTPVQVTLLGSVPAGLGGSGSSEKSTVPRPVAYTREKRHCCALAPGAIPELGSAAAIHLPA
jgi:hypothetical protein